MIPKLNSTQILVYSSALQCKKVQSSIDKSSIIKLRKTENISFNLNIRVPLESVNLFLHVFLYLKVILTMEHYIKLLTTFIWKFAIFSSWELGLWNLEQLAPASFFYLQQAYGQHVWDIYILTSPRIRQKDTFQNNNSLLCWKRRLIVYYVKTERVKFYFAWKIM